MGVQMVDEQTGQPESDAGFYCPNCTKEVKVPLRCGDCGSLICRDCGTPLERTDELGLG
jgi:hypothetical protein